MEEVESFDEVCRMINGGLEKRRGIRVLIGRVYNR